MDHSVNGLGLGRLGCREYAELKPWVPCVVHGKKAAF